MTTITVFGNWGELTVDADTGEVLAYAPGVDFDPAQPAEGYCDIAKIDLVEWRAYLETHGFSMPGSTDILNVGYWDKSGEYEPATDFRAVWFDDAKAGQVGGSIVTGAAVNALLGGEKPE